jgi:hypothetical protein
MAAVLGVLLLAGCLGDGHNKPQPTDSERLGAQVVPTRRFTDTDLTAIDAARPTQVIYLVNVYQVSVPLGTISRNEEFWRRIEESSLRVHKYDLLLKNGVRLGQAPLSELEHLGQFIDLSVPMQRTMITGREVRNLQIELRRDLPSQVIFHYDAANNLIGREYDRCENVINLSFSPAPRKPGQIRLELAPMVRVQRRRLEFTLMHGEREIAYVSPEVIYDLALRLDIERDSFLVITPSADAERETSVGHAFFVQQGPTDRMEQVLLIIPEARVVEESSR